MTTKAWIDLVFVLGTVLFLLVLWSPELKRAWYDHRIRKMLKRDRKYRISM